MIRPTLSILTVGLLCGCASPSSDQSTISRRGLQNGGRIVRSKSGEPERAEKMVSHPCVQLYVHEELSPEMIKKTVLIPPLGIDSNQVREDFSLQIYNHTQRYFSKPVDRISTHSSFKPYIEDNNLIAPDGFLNLPELCAIGQLKNASHILCPIVEEITPYPPQKITLRIALIDIDEKKIVAELSGSFDSKDRASCDAFAAYLKENENESNRPEDLRMQIQSPLKYRRFVAYLCCKMLSQNLPL